MDDVQCFGNETSILQCRHSGWNVHNCGPEEAIYLVCAVPGESSCSYGEWSCKNSSECIEISYLCDDVNDCEDHSDENFQMCNVSYFLIVSYYYI